VDQAGDGYGLFADIVDELVSKVSGTWHTKRSKGSI
jgi:hypothetical protein